MASFTSPVPVPAIDATGCHVPDFTAVYTGVAAIFQTVYGQDISLDPATLDGKFVGILAQAFKDHCDAFLACYNAFSPVTAQGAGLSSVVKVNGIQRDAASYSTVDIVNIGQANRTITGPQIRDGSGNLWSMPDFTIPFGGAITVTATCTVLGAIAVPAGQVSPDYWTLATPQLGWQSVSNPAAAATGAAVETDAALRVRQGLSTMAPSQTVVDGIEAAILALPGVNRVKPYENDDDTVDANGIPAHGTAFVVDGGDAMAICQAIALRKTDGSPTYGNTYQTVLQGRAQIPRRINFFRVVTPVITYQVQVTTYTGYTLDTRAAIQQALVDFTNAVPIGGTEGGISVNDAYEPVLGVSLGGARPFRLKAITMARGGAQTQAADVPLAFYEAPTCSLANVQVVETAG